MEKREFKVEITIEYHEEDLNIKEITNTLLDCIEGMTPFTTKNRFSPNIQITDEKIDDTDSGYPKLICPHCNKNVFAPMFSKGD